jgi:hypothetical protein
VYKILITESEGKRPIGRLGLRWEINIKMEFREIGLEGPWNGFIWLRIGISVGLF